MIPLPELYTEIRIEYRPMWTTLRPPARRVYLFPIQHDVTPYIAFIQLVYGHIASTQHANMPIEIGIEPPAFVNRHYHTTVFP